MPHLRMQYHQDPVMPGAFDQKLAALSSQKLAALCAKETDEHSLTMMLSNQETIKLPFSVVQLLIQILVQMAEGNAVTLVPIHAYLTTQEAADLLHVSRPYLIKLLEKGEMPFEKVGTHRRIKAEDVFSYQIKIEADKKDALNELTRQAQELDMGY